MSRSSSVVLAVTMALHCLPVVRAQSEGAPALEVYCDSSRIGADRLPVVRVSGPWGTVEVLTTPERARYYGFSRPIERAPLRLLVASHAAALDRPPIDSYAPSLFLDRLSAVPFLYEPVLGRRAASVTNLFEGELRRPWEASPTIPWVPRGSAGRVHLDADTLVMSRYVVGHGSVVVRDPRSARRSVVQLSDSATYQASGGWVLDRQLSLVQSPGRPHRFLNLARGQDLSEFATFIADERSVLEMSGGVPTHPESIQWEGNVWWSRPDTPPPDAALPPDAPVVDRLWSFVEGGRENFSFRAVPTAGSAGEPRVVKMLASPDGSGLSPMPYESRQTWRYLLGAALRERAPVSFPSNGLPPVDPRGHVRLAIRSSGLSVHLTRNWGWQPMFRVGGDSYIQSTILTMGSSRQLAGYDQVPVDGGRRIESVPRYDRDATVWALTRAAGGYSLLALPPNDSEAFAGQLSDLPEAVRELMVLVACRHTRGLAFERTTPFLSSIRVVTSRTRLVASPLVRPIEPTRVQVVYRTVP